MTPDEFLNWELHSKDTIDVKRIYIDIAGDVASGILLSQLMYWHLPDKKGEPKMEVEEEGVLWVRKKREDWWEECRLTPKQFDRSSNILKEKGFAEIKQFKHEGRKTTHIRLLIENIITGIEEFDKKKGAEGSDGSQKGSYGSQKGSDTIPKGKCEGGEEPCPARVSGSENLQTTSKTTTKNTLRRGNVPKNVEQEKQGKEERNRVECIPDGNVVVPNFADCKLYNVLNSRTHNFRAENRTVGDVDKFKDTKYRFGRKYTKVEYAEALKLYNRLPDNDDHKIRMAEYIGHEERKWDYSETKNEEVVKARFILEYLFWNPVYQHFCKIKEKGLQEDDVLMYNERNNKEQGMYIPKEIYDEFATA